MASKRRKGGRPRKTGPRHKNGHLKAVMAESPRERATHMPHRRGLGDNASDPDAESELGRMRLRGQISEPEATAGSLYARMWRGYVSTLDAPRTPGEGQGRVSACAGCSDPSSRKYCACDLRRRIWNEALRVLVGIGIGVSPAVHAVVILDRPCLNVPLLRLGLSGLAEHYGLTNQRKRAYRNERSQKHVAVSNP
jgi:hypothetical protein